MAAPIVASSASTSTSLLSRLRNADDRDAWREFEGRYRELVLRYCRRKGLKEAEADDMMQLLMLRLVKAMPAFDYQPARGRFRDYLYRIVRNILIDAARRPKPVGRPVLDEGALANLAGESAPPPDEIWEQEWVDHHYRLAMTTIRKDFESRSVEMFDRLLAGQRVEDVAAAFSATSQAVHKVKQRIRDRLRELIAEQIREEDGV